jgi:hypothetical protein
VGPGLTVESGVGYLLLVSKGRAALAKDGEIEEDPEKRKPVPHMTWYIGARTPDAALPLTLSPAERREGTNIRMATGPGYCIHGRVRAGAVPGGSLQVVFAEAPMASQGILGHSTFEKKLDADPAQETTLNICNLSPGDYRVTSALVTRPNTFPREFHTQVVTVTDRDLKVSLDGKPPIRVYGEIVWDGEPLYGTVTMSLRPINHVILPQETVGAKVASPGPFTFDRLLADEYELELSGLPGGAYLKDITSGGRSIVHRPLLAGSVGDLRVILAHDGARITAQASADTWVVVVPAAATTEIAVADTMVWGRGDATGTWTSPLLAPGKYLVLSSSAPVDRSVESVERVFRSRSKASEADLGPGANVSVKLTESRP